MEVLTLTYEGWRRDLGRDLSSTTTPEFNYKSFKTSIGHVSEFKPWNSFIVTQFGLKQADPNGQCGVQLDFSRGQAVKLRGLQYALKFVLAK